MTLPSSRRVRAAAETLVSAGGEPTQFQYVIAAGLSVHGMPTDAALRTAIGCIRSAIEEADKADNLTDVGRLSPDAALRAAAAAALAEVTSRLVLKWRKLTG